MNVHVVDYGLGNLHSVLNALSHLGAAVTVAENGAALAGAGLVLLPGVGAFAEGMAGLERRKHAAALRAHAAAGRPLAGICLGAQLLLDTSEEFGEHAGLGIIPGRVVRIPGAGVKVPHVGWSCLEPSAPWAGTPLAGTAPGTWGYFVHSFHMVPCDRADVLAVTRHGPHTLTAAVRRGAVTGFQYHPEKSGQAGLAQLAAFLSEN